MADYADPIGKGGIWVKDGKKGKFFSWSCTFSYNGHEVTARGVAFRNDKKEGQQPDYRMTEAYDVCSKYLRELIYSREIKRRRKNG